MKVFRFDFYVETGRVEKQLGPVAEGHLKSVRVYQAQVGHEGRKPLPRSFRGSKMPMEDVPAFLRACADELEKE